MQVRLKSTRMAVLSYIPHSSYTAFLVCFMRREDDRRGSHTLERPEIHMPYRWCCHLAHQPKVEFARFLPGTIKCRHPPHPAHILFLRHKQLRMFAHTQRVKVELSSTCWGWGINMNYLEFFCREDWSLLPGLRFYWPSSRRHWNQSDRFHT